MSTTTLKPHPVLGAVEAMRLRETFDRVLEDGSPAVTVDLSGVRELSTAGITAVTSFLAHGHRSGVTVRLQLPEQAAAREIIEQADLGRFLAPGGMWNPHPARHNGSMSMDQIFSPAA